MNMYCVYDRVAGEASAPFIQKNDGCARRAFEKLMCETGVAGSDDFKLCFIGVFDGSTMNIEQYEVLFIMGSDEVEVKKNETIEMFPEES